MPGAHDSGKPTTEKPTFRYAQHEIHPVILSVALNGQFL